MRIWMLLKRSVSLNFESKQAIEVNCSQKYSVILLACCDDWHWRDALSCSTHENIKYQICLGFRFDVQEYSAVQRGRFSHLWGQYCSPVRVHQCQRKNWTGKVEKVKILCSIFTFCISPQEPDEADDEDDNSRMDVDEDSRASSTGSAKKKEKGRSSKKKKKVVMSSEDEDD